MNLIEPAIQRELIALSETPEGLSVIHQRNCAAAVWQRQPLASFQAWIDSLPADQFPETRTVLPISAVRATTTQVCELCGTPACHERSLLIDDIAATAHVFSELTNVRYVFMTLEAITTNSCQNFHIDAISARMVCTYRGTGTQLSARPETGQLRRVYTTPTGAPVLMRGTLWPEHPNATLQHRSPPIEGKGETRMVLTLDVVSEPDYQTNLHVVH